MAGHTRLIPHSLSSRHASFWTAHLMPGPMYKIEWWKLTHAVSTFVLLQVTTNLLFQAGLTLQCFKIQTADTTEARYSCIGCKSSSTPLGHSSKGFLDSNNHWKTYCCYLQLRSDHCIEKEGSTALHRGYMRSVCIEELVILPLQDNDTLCQAVINHPFSRIVSSQATVNDLSQQHEVACYHQRTTLRILFQTLTCGCFSQSPEPRKADDSRPKRSPT